MNGTLIDRDTYTELNEQAHEKDLENAEKRQRDFAEAWSMVGDVFWHLWD